MCGVRAARRHIGIKILQNATVSEDENEFIQQENTYQNRECENQEKCRMTPKMTVQLPMNKNTLVDNQIHKYIFPSALATANKE